jgi:hypothetical protein
MDLNMKLQVDKKLSENISGMDSIPENFYIMLKK